MVCFCQQGIYSRCSSISHKVAYAESVPKSHARAGRLRFLAVYSASVILDCDTDLVEIHMDGWMDEIRDFLSQCVV